MEAIRLPDNKEWKLKVKRPEIDMQLIRMLNTFTRNRVGDEILQECRTVHGYFMEQFGRYRDLTSMQQELLQRRADQWTQMVEKAFSRKLSSMLNEEEFNGMAVTVELHQFLQKTRSLLRLMM